MASPLVEPKSKALAVRLRAKVNESFTLDAEFEAEPGFTVLFGASGSGKSTILECLAGLRKVDDGYVRIADRVLFDSSARLNRTAGERGIGFVFQDLALFPHLSAAENIEFGLFRLDREERERRTKELLEHFGIAHLAERRPGEISGGERQRVALARALAPKPDLVLLDEPMSALDASTKSAILSRLLAWNEQHAVPVLYVTHDRAEVFSLARRVLVLKDGKIVAKGTAHEALERPFSLSTARIGGFENIFTARVVSADRGSVGCAIGDGVVLDCPPVDVKPGDTVDVAVRAGDILLAIEEPRGISARNILSATIGAVERGDAHVVVEALCGEHKAVAFEVHVTPKALESLGLATGREVWLVVKTHSCHLLRG